MGAAVKSAGRRVRGRSFVTWVCAGIAAVLLVVLGASTTVCARQTARVFRLGLLIPASSQALPLPSINAFLQRLDELGYAEGRNLVIERRFPEERPERFPELAADLAQNKPDAIVAVSTPAALAVKQGTQPVPVVISDGQSKGRVESR